MEFEGLSIEVSDEVYEPSDDSLLAAELVKEYLSRQDNKRIDVLDMGTGTGVLGLVCAKSGKAKSVTFVEASKAWDGGEEGIELSIRFLEGLGEHLKSGGRAVLVASTTSEYDKLLDAIESLGYSVEATKKARFFFEEIVAMLIE